MVATMALRTVLKIMATFTDLDKTNCVLKGGRTYSAIAVQNSHDFRLPLQYQWALGCFGMLFSLDWQ